MYLIYCKMLLFHGKVTFFFFLLYEVASFQFWKPPFCSWWCWWWVVCVWELRKQLRWKQQKSIVQYYNWDIVSRRFNLKTFFTSFLFFFFFCLIFFFQTRFSLLLFYGNFWKYKLSFATSVTHWLTYGQWHVPFEARTGSCGAASQRGHPCSPPDYQTLVIQTN